jgi:hypothetical protein
MLVHESLKVIEASTPRIPAHMICWRSPGKGSCGVVFGGTTVNPSRRIAERLVAAVPASRMMRISMPLHPICGRGGVLK